MARTVRRIVTRHDMAGKAIVWMDDQLATEPITEAGDAFCKVWTTDGSPADPNEEIDGAARPTGLALPGGSVLRVVDHVPGARSPMHRTRSVDYGILVEGRLDMELDSGDLVRLEPGDIVVQRGTNHAWVNNYDEVARMVFILLDAKPVVVGGQVLDEENHQVAASHL